MYEMMPFTRNHGVDLYRPFRDLEELERSLFANSSAAAFKTDIRDTGDAYVLEADLPGMKKRTSTSTLTATVCPSAPNAAPSRRRRMRTAGISAASGPTAPSPGVSTSPASGGEDISAAYADGVLTLTLPKQTKTVPAARRLDIQ